MVIKDKIYYKNRENFVSAIAIHVAREMVEKGKGYDLCELLRQQLSDNLKKTKDNKYPFKFGSLVVFFSFYFFKELP